MEQSKPHINRKTTFIQNWVSDLKRVKSEISQLKHLAWFLKNNIPVHRKLKVEFNQQQHKKLVQELAMLELEDLIEQPETERQEKTPVPLYVGVSIRAFQPVNKLYKA